MRLLTLLLVPAALLAGPTRYARLGDFQGKVEVQLTAADPWMPAQRNLPILESTWLRTGPASRLEIELDDGGAYRLGPDSVAEISDYTRLSTGQRITLLSLDRGTAYYTGEPQKSDVIMLIVPGAQATLQQGSRLRLTAQPGWSQIAVLEGLVRFSSPAAEMDIREGATARVEPPVPSRFRLEPSIAVQPLDRWSEDRDKLENAPASAAYVTARYGLPDLDANGRWVPTDDLGKVWKPDVADGWAPYRAGHWQYFDTLGYTWVSDESWGWLPYHNGRWMRKNDLGWVWQPSVSSVFYPGEVYWVRGENFAGWGPLAPGEQWNTPAAGTLVPWGYTNGLTTFAGFLPDTRLINSAGFPAPTAEQFKTAVFVPALASPAFLTSRLDATRPVLGVGTTRVLPSVRGVNFNDATVNDPPPDQSADAGVTPPPDGVYPVMRPVQVDTSGVLNPPDHPDYARRPPATSGQSAQTGQTGQSGLGGKPGPPVKNPTTSVANGGEPVRQNPTPPASTPVKHPAGDPVQIPVRPPVSAPVPAPPVPKQNLVQAEETFHRLVLHDIDPAAPNFVKALADLNAWTKDYPKSALLNDRKYYYIHVFNATGHPDKVLDMAGPMIEAGIRGTFQDEQQILQILVAASSSVQKLPRPTAPQVATAQEAARELLDFLPSYFAPRRKPKNVSDGEWSLARVQLEGVAHDALARRDPARPAVN